MLILLPLLPPTAVVTCANLNLQSKTYHFVSYEKQNKLNENGQFNSLTHPTEVEKKEGNFIFRRIFNRTLELMLETSATRTASSAENKAKVHTVATNFDNKIECDSTPSIDRIEYRFCHCNIFLKIHNCFFNIFNFRNI